jgi:hypothetical protein
MGGLVGFEFARNGWVAQVDNIFLRLGGFAKVDNGFWVDLILTRGEYRKDAIIYQKCIKTMSVKGGAYAYEACEAKKKNCYVFYMGPTSLYVYIYTT